MSRRIRRIAVCEDDLHHDDFFDDDTKSSPSSSPTGRWEITGRESGAGNKMQCCLFLSHDGLRDPVDPQFVS